MVIEESAVCCYVILKLWVNWNERPPIKCGLIVITWDYYSTHKVTCIHWRTQSATLENKVVAQSSAVIIWTFGCCYAFNTFPIIFFMYYIFDRPTQNHHTNRWLNKFNKAEEVIKKGVAQGNRNAGFFYMSINQTIF